MGDHRAKEIQEKGSILSPYFSGKESPLYDVCTTLNREPLRGDLRGKACRLVQTSKPKPIVMYAGLVGVVPCAEEIEGESLLLWTLLGEEEKENRIGIEDLLTGRVWLTEESNGSIVI